MSNWCDVNISMEGPKNILYKIMESVQYDKEMENNIHFDIVIANPPYSIKSQVTSSIINNVDFDEFINLMPKSGYRGDNYKYIKEIESVGNFFDAQVGTVLTIATLSSTPTDVFDSYEEVNDATVNPVFIKFYEINKFRQSSFTATTILNNPKTLGKELNPDTDFFILIRTAKNGIDGSGGMYEWNNKLKSKEELMDTVVRDYPKHRSPNNPTGTLIRGQFIFFNTAVEKDNFTEWYYSKGRDGLAHKLIIGLAKTGGQITNAIPKVDWSRPWTDEEILLDFGYTPEEIRDILFRG